MQNIIKSLLLITTFTLLAYAIKTNALEIPETKNCYHNGVYFASIPLTASCGAAHVSAVESPGGNPALCMITNNPLFPDL